MDQVLFSYPPMKIEPGSKLDPSKLCKALGAREAKFLGSGGFGETWLVQLDGGPAAIKILHTATPERLEREIEALQRCNSPHVVRLIEYRSIEYNRKQLPALVFEYVDGGDLYSHIERGNWPKSLGELRSFAIGLLRGVVELHRRDVIHRDIKPQNIILRNGNYASPVLVDLGIARLVDLETITRYPMALGTLPFMAPEQLRGERAHKGTDVWAVGVVLYMLATRRHPFYTDVPIDYEDALDRLGTGPDPLPESLPEEFTRVVLRMLEPQVHRRGTAARNLAELEGWSVQQ